MTSVNDIFTSIVLLSSLKPERRKNTPKFIRRVFKKTQTIYQREMMLICYNRCAILRSSHSISSWQSHEVNSGVGERLRAHTPTREIFT